jgi:hypothetical protein
MNSKRSTPRAYKANVALSAMETHSNWFHVFAPLSVAAALQCLFAAQVSAQPNARQPALGPQEATPLFVRIPAPHDVFGVWRTLPDPGTSYRQYMAIMPTGRCASLVTRTASGKEPPALTGKDVIRQIDDRTGSDPVAGWHACSVAGGTLTEAAHADTVEVHYALHMTSYAPKGAQPYSGRAGQAGDLILQQYYKFTPAPQPRVHVLQPVPVAMRRVED